MYQVCSQKEIQEIKAISFVFLLYQYDSTGHILFTYLLIVYFMILLLHLLEFSKHIIISAVPKQWLMNALQVYKIFQCDNL
jgi:hypothetical protein